VLHDLLNVILQATRQHSYAAVVDS
jgi:hypothetical protein